MPGWAGDSWVKWVTDIEARDQEFDGFFMKTAYRRPKRTVMPGAAVDPADMQPVTAIRPKSHDRDTAGRAEIRGGAP